MSRIARVIAAGIPHHITQRGNRRLQTFFCDDDYTTYLSLMSQWCQKTGIQIWSYCLMPNHVHLIAVPQDEASLRSGIGEAHRRYSRHVNFREGWRGHLWQGRFASFPMDENYLLAAARYIELNPVTAGLAEKASDWRWSSARAHLSGDDDILVSVKPLLDIAPDWREFLGSPVSQEEIQTLRTHERTGRPLGGETFVEKMENLLDRCLKKQKPGPKAKGN